MFVDDEGSNEGFDVLRQRKDELEEVARSIGLYLEDWAPVSLGEDQQSTDDEESEDEDVAKAQNLLLHAIFTVGNLAFSDRVQEDPEKIRIREEFENIMQAGIHDRAIDAVRKLKNSGLTDDDD